MGARGPQPKPSYLRLLEANPSGRPFNPSEASVPLSQTLEPPAFFSAARKTIWAAVCKELAAMGGLSSVDYEMLVLYVDTLFMARQLILRTQAIENNTTLNPKMEYVRDEKGNILKNPDGSLRQEAVAMKPNPWFNQLVTQKKLALLFASHFGMTPSARARIVFLGNSGNDPDRDPFDI